MTTFPQIIARTGGDPLPPHAAQILIYEPLPDINRAPIWAAFARSLASSGYKVAILVEPSLLYSANADNSSVSVIDCAHVINAYLDTEPSFETIKLRISADIYANIDADNVNERIRLVRSARKAQYRAVMERLKPHTCYVWNGQYNYLSDFLDIARTTGNTLLQFVECGWFPQSGTIYIDRKGVNAASRLAEEIAQLIKARQAEFPASNPFRESLPGKKRSYIFVPLQVDTDTNITIHSSYSSMNEFIAHLEQWIPPELNVVLRPHPLYDRTRPLQRKRKNFFIDSTLPIRELIKNAELVIGLNSTVLLEALSAGKPVITMAKGILPPTYDGQDFVDTPPITPAIAHDCLERLKSTQIYVSDIREAAPNKPGHARNGSLAADIFSAGFRLKKAYFEYRKRHLPKKHALIYLPLANEHRLPIFQQIGASLRQSGFHTSIIVETQISHYQNGIYKGESSHARSIARYANPDSFDEILVFKWNTSAEDYWNGISSVRSRKYRELLGSRKWDRIYVWNGNFDYQQDFIEQAKATGNEGTLQFCEVGWLSQTDSIYVDPLGVNAYSYLSITPPDEITEAEFQQVDAFIRSWKRNVSNNTAPKTRPAILVPLQVDTDSNILLSSPFRSMAEFIRHLENWVPDTYDVVLRPHPKASYAYEITSTRANFSVDRQTPLHELMNRCDFVIGINSTVLIEALCLHKPAAAFGNGVFSSSTAINSLTIDSPFSEPRFDITEAYKLLHRLVFKSQQRIYPELARKNNPLRYALMLLWIKFLKKYDA
jgi:capsule polysaccharide modification protein KpsS